MTSSTNCAYLMEDTILFLIPLLCKACLINLQILNLISVAYIDTTSAVRVIGIKQLYFETKQLLFITHAILTLYIV